MRRCRLAFSVALLWLLKLSSQTTFPSNGAPYTPHSVYAFVNAVLVVDYQTQIKNGALLIQDGKILEAGENISVPKNAVVIDLKGKYIYPSFIDLYSDYGLNSNRYPKKERGPQLETTQKGAYGWNMSIRSDQHAAGAFAHQPDKAEDYRKNGFGIVLTSFKDGIVRGSGALVHLNSSDRENESMIVDKAAGFYSFQKGSSPQDYPSSLAGSIALLRQTYYDADWYAANKPAGEYNISLEEFIKLRNLPAVFETNDKFAVSRVAALAKEFKTTYLIKGSGTEYQRISDMQVSNFKFILPLNFPEAYDVEDPYDAEAISLADLKHWELAPANPAFLEKNLVPFCLTSADLKDKSDFLKNLRTAVKYGLTEKTALKALTLQPATFMNLQDKMGALRKGYFADFFISNTSIFKDDCTILHHWVNGRPFVYADVEMPDLRGSYTLSLNQTTYKVSLSGDAAKPKAQVTVDTTKKTFHYSYMAGVFGFHFSKDSVNTVRGSGNYDAATKEVRGSAQLTDGNWTTFKLTWLAAADTLKTASTAKTEQAPVLGSVFYPFSAYGEVLPETSGVFTDAWTKFKSRYGAILIKDATVWTNEGDTVLQDYDVYVVDGKIVRIAPNIDAPKLAFAKVIQAKGMHLTPGIIDEHSHIALTAGVNEGTQASSAEVRMGDVINPDDINIYRQLSGGVTTAQLLHGSANPIGGQSAIIKLRWGHNAEAMKFEKADGFIKFALGENVKQSNWGDLNTVRFPQSRMGVEQVFIDHFTRAREYDRLMNGSDRSKLPRRDLELDALAEILNKKRFITCHSYVQSEINMLMHVADSMGFKVNTFTHILEGYKVADKMKVHGVNASTFSDWWAYKNEVMEAIPYNAALLTRMGVNCAINSDDAEMARRLNQEAAKSIKYGGLTETEALKLVTLNPAKMLHIDQQVGSIKVGKVADLVLWTDNPLSVYAKVDKTIIDGQIYFDREADAKLRDNIKAERARIIAKLLAEKQKGTKLAKPKSKQQRLYHCNTLEGVAEEETGIR